LNADPNLKPRKGPAPVWMAVIQDERESIKSLVQYGANSELDQKLAMLWPSISLKSLKFPWISV